MDTTSITQTGTLLLLNVPPKSFCGINLLSFTTSLRFHGIKLIPPGYHFVFTSPSSAFSIRHGTWTYIRTPADTRAAIEGGDAGARGPQLIVKKWDADKEELVQEQDEAELMRWSANLGSIYKEGLTPYRQSANARETSEDDGQEFHVEETGDWNKLTSAISGALLTRITGGGRNHWTLTSASSAVRDLDDIPGITLESQKAIMPEKDLTFLYIDLKRTWREGATGRERTEAAQDRSWALGDLIDRYGGGAKGEKQILGEMQFCFLMILTLNNHSCLEQWKRILSLIFTCRAAISSQSLFFVEVLKTLFLQLHHLKDVETGLFDMSDDSGNLLKSLLVKFRRNVQSLPGSTSKQEVSDELDELSEFLTDEYGWHIDDSFVRRGMIDLEDGERVEMDVGVGMDEEDEQGEYAPMIVELTDDQAKEMGIDRRTIGNLKLSSGKNLSNEVVDVEDKTPFHMQEDDSEDDTLLEDMDARY